MTSRRSLGAQLLHRRQHLGAPLLGHVEPELLRLDADRVEPALLAEHDRALRRDELGRVRLDRLRVVELRRDRAGLAPVERLAGHRLPRLELVAGQLAHARRDLADPVEPQVRLDAVERAQRQRDLAEVRVAGALAHPVDRPVHVRRRPRARRRPRTRWRRRSRCGRGSAPARRRARPCGRRARRPPRARRSRACRRRRPPSRPPRPPSSRPGRRSRARRASSRRRRTPRGCRARRRSASRS